MDQPATTFEPDEVKPIHGGTRAWYKFPNGYGASVIRHQYSYGGPAGLWELAVTAHDGGLIYSTPVTSDVLGHLSDADVDETLSQIQALPDKEN